MWGGDRKFVGTLLRGFLIAVVAGGWTAVAAAATSVLKPGDHTLKLDGGRKYLLHIPPKLDSSQPVPLVLFFHGGGGHMEQAADDYGWREKSDKEGFIVAFPNGSSHFPRQHLATWNAGRCCGYARDNKVDDVAFVREVVSDIERKANVDHKQIFATGMSNGGMMAYRLACEAADLFKAIAPVAGTDNTEGCTPSQPISVLHIHARDDTHVLFNGGAGKDAFRDLSKVTDFTSVNDTIQRWVKLTQADPKARRVLEVPGAIGDLYTSPRNEAQVESVVTDTGGHSWPGGRAVRGKHPSQAINATDLIWDFFRHPAR
ncbi:MAG TPA: PHB depolymerase family esterase [Dongiaceae bacterium]|nr:PHB depolymerase family esterase [Dongiaceae bacterium]